MIAVTFSVKKADTLTLQYVYSILPTCVANPLRKETFDTRYISRDMVDSISTFTWLNLII